MLDQPVWERGRANREQEREKREIFIDRSSTFSLEFPTIGLSNPGEPRSKIAPHCKSYVWALVLWSFDNFGRYVSSPTWFIFGLRVIEMVWMV